MVKSSWVPKYDLGRLFREIHVRHSLPPFMSIGLFQEKFWKVVGWWYKYISEKTLGIYIFVTLPLENKLSPLEIPQICATPVGDSKPKNPGPMQNPHDFFLITPRKSTSFLIDPGISAFFFQYPLKFHILNSLCFFF